MRWLTAFLIVLGSAAPAWAFTCTPTGCTFEVDYTEPTVNTAGGPVNLTGTKIYYLVNGGTEKSVTVAPSSATGGTAIKQNVTDATLLPGFNYTISAQVTALNAAGESLRTTAATLAIPRAGEVPPGPPSGLILK